MKEYNPLYKDIDIQINNIPTEFVSIREPDAATDFTDNMSNNFSEEEDENPLDRFRFNSQETLLISNITSPEEVSIAPGEGKQPSSILSDKFCEEVAFLYLFPNGKFGFNVNQDVKLSFVKFFNQRLS